MNDGNVILGIDPGTTIMGYGVVKANNKIPSLLLLGTLDLRKISDHYQKIARVFERTLQLIDDYKPDALAIEAPFYGKNIQSMLKLGRAQGAAISAALFRSVPVFEYAPRRIKQSISGYGNASKEQISDLLQKMLKFDKLPGSFDATDGLAAAMCHFYQNNISIPSKSSKGWSDFIKNNPDRVK